jgi:ribulose-5-phosphate 4-epimerase/fuculose-1-phosphate aldolase
VELSNGKTDEAVSGDISTLRRKVALACRILAHTGLVEDVLGHVSVRVGADRMLLRCRGPEDRGLLFTRDDDIRIVDFDGSGELDGGYVVPNELPIHAELLRARPELTSVVHAHPRSALLVGLADLPLRPVFGAYNIPAYRMAADGVPVYPRPVLIRSADLGRELVEAMGASSQCLLRGHGIVVAGGSVEQAVVRALNLEEMARVTVELSRLRTMPRPVAEQDRTELPDLGGAFNDLSVWRHHLGRLERAGLAGPEAVFTRGTRKVSG